MSPKLISIKNKSIKKQPREKIIEYGIESLNDDELISVILGTGYKSMNVNQLSKYLLTEFGVRGLLEFKDLLHFQSQSGLPLVKSCVLLAMGEYIRRLQKKDHTQIKSSEQLYRYIKEDFKNLTIEQLRIVCVDSQRRILFSGLIAQGKANALVVDLSEVFHHPIRLNCKHFYLIHNHPQGRFNPSKEDIQFTLEIKKQAHIFGLEFDDHLVLGEDGFYSFSLAGTL